MVPKPFLSIGHFFAVEQTLAKHETKQSDEITRSNEKCYILTAVQQVLLTTAWFCSKLYTLDKHFIMKVRTILSTPSCQTASKCSHLHPGHSKQLQTPTQCLILLEFSSCSRACKRERTFDASTRQWSIPQPSLNCAVSNIKPLEAAKSKKNKINNPFVHKCLQQEVTLYFPFAKSESFCAMIRTAWLNGGFIS